MKKNFFFNHLSMVLLLAFLVVGGLRCKEDIGIEINKVGEKPGPVSNVQVTPISGGAVIKYTLPLSEDLRYVKATYKLDNGIERKAKSSIYKNEIIVDGFGKEGSYDIELRSVSVGEVESEPTTIKVDVLRPPHQLVLDKMESGSIVTTFGGLNLTYVNETKADLVIRVIKKDASGAWNPVEAAYTNFETGTIRIRGQQAVPTDFGVFIEDRWDHSSDTLVMNLTPIEEVAIPRDRWEKISLPGDVGNRGGGFDYRGIWDGNTNRGYLSTNSGVTPVDANSSAFTLDLGVPVLLSRMLIWATRYSNINDVYGPAHIFDFEVYGSNQPNPSGAWDSTWTRLDHFESVRPSGFAFGVPATTTERDYIRDNGETYEFSDPVAFEKFRYIRFKVNAGWSGVFEGNPTFFIYELYLYGQL
ncbi:DUF4959 domain-containing protein [Niabella insulamsoli]|uniref:DUF4959 domain-containing protein n=1 Tax=Niabella insulamsoli TaxID=3144874 RepID=UPI0031FE26E3